MGPGAPGPARAEAAAVADLLRDVGRSAVTARPRLLDLFCGAGGCSVGYHRAGFDVTGVDINPMPNYPFDFVQADAMTFPLDGFDAIHASPPCHDHSALAVLHPAHGTAWMLPATRDRLRASGVPWVIENVPGADMPGAITFCGTEFGLRTVRDGKEYWLRRHRLFEASFHLWGAGGCHCYRRQTVGVYGGGPGGSKMRRGRSLAMTGPGTARASREVMGIDWMNRRELDQAIPPAYTQFIGEQLLTQVGHDVSGSV